MHSFRRRLRDRFYGRTPKPTYKELVEQLDALTALAEEQRRIVDAAGDLIEAMWLLDSKGNPAITIKCDDPVDAETIRHRIWELQCLAEGQEPPVPVFIQGVYH